MSDRLRILWLKTGPLHPLDTGGKLRTFNMLRELQRRHHVTYLALCPPDTGGTVKQSAREYSQAQIWIPWRETKKMSPAFFAGLARNQFLSRLPYVIQKYQSPAMAAVIREADQAGKFDLIICDFLTPAVNLLPGPGRPATPTLLFQHNVESLIWQRTFETARGTLKRAYLRGQWRRMVAYEREACSRVNSVVAVSGEDCRLLRAELGLANILGSVPTGVDTEFFQPSSRQPQPCSLVFLGSMDWMPNIDGVMFFTEEIFPLVKQTLPGVTLTIVGRNPPARVRELAGRDPAIKVTGTVDDVRPHLAAAEAMIVPLRVGGGTRIKIFEAMATGIPVIATRIGAEGLPVNHGEHVLLADAPADFARETVALLTQPEQRQRIGQAGLRLVREQFGWAAVNEVFEGYCRAVAGKGGAQ